MKGPTRRGGDSKFNRPAGRIIVFDSSTQTLPEQANIVSSSQDVIEDFDVVEEPQGVESLVYVLDLLPNDDRVPLPLPPSNNFLGDYGFDVDFTINSDNSVVYSISRDKLYVAKDQPCVFNFMVSSDVPINTVLRVTSIFVKAEHAKFNVLRCLNHATEDIQKGIPACDHIIRCDNPDSLYVKNQSTSRRSLILPFKRPIIGSLLSSYVLKFTCHSSCPGGLNRRPIRTIFTLEHDGNVIGRRSVELKICSSPWRDCNNDDKRMNRLLTPIPPPPKDNTLNYTRVSSKKRKHEGISGPIVDIFQFVNDFMSVKKKKSSKNLSCGDSYVIQARDAEEFRVLQQAKVLYEFFKFIQNIQPEDIVNWICRNKRSKKS